MYNKVELCGVNTAELPILSEQEKRDLLTRARAGDKEARQSMIEGNLRLVLSVVQRFSQRGENMDDLYPCCCLHEPFQGFPHVRCLMPAACP